MKLFADLSIARRKLIYVMVTLSICFFLALVLVPLNIDKSYSTIVLAQDSTVIHAFLSDDDKWRMFTELNEISPELQRAIVYKEDKYFNYHFGVNPLAIIRAFVLNTVYSRRTSGASTINMQVIRLLNPKPRTYLNKSLEIFQAMQLEIRYSKKEILQLYLNLVPYGGNIEGVKAAALLYFQKGPDHLSLAEVTALSIIPNRPGSLKLGYHNEEIKRQRDKWLRRFLEEEVFSHEAISDALDEGLHASRVTAPKFSPHFAYRMKNQYPDKYIIRTRLNSRRQQEIEKIVKNYIDILYSMRIRNAAAIVINNETGGVEAYVGSADFNNNEDAGQVDGIRAVRSPGSTLKPLLYATAFDLGLVTPLSIINDVQVNYSGYEPRNFDEKFRGQVTIRQALSTSLNIPAVKIMHQMRPKTLIDQLIKADFESIKKNKNFLGLSTVLGGCGVTLEELTRLYRSFANDGKLSNYNWLQTDNDTSTVSLISDKSTFMLTEILTEVTRPDLPNEWKNSTNIPRVAWKTGTSYGRRDAWSIGYNNEYTVGVWVGNFSGEGVSELTGTDMAAPLLFKLFNSISKNSQEEWFEMPKDLGFRYVCTQTGLRPSSTCDVQVIDYFIPGISDYRECRHLRPVHISADSLTSYCNSCLPNAGYIEALYPNFAPELIDYYEREQVNYKSIPLHNPQCERIFTKGAPKITSPVEGVEYYVSKTDSTEIKLSCHTEGNVERVYWYVNDRFLTSSLANEHVFYMPPEGPLKVSCTDDRGRNTDVEVMVKLGLY